jgi:hypothetical protein
MGRISVFKKLELPLFKKQFAVFVYVMYVNKQMFFEKTPSCLV